MTDTDTPEAQPAAMKDQAACADAREARRQAAFAGNRATLFEALERRGIQAVAASFDGYGDSGQFEEVSVTAGTEHDLGAIETQQKKAIWHQDTVETVTVALSTAIEELCYALLDQTHCGWCDNGGGSGEFIFDVPARTITLEFNERYVSYETYSHQF